MQNYADYNPRLPKPFDSSIACMFVKSTSFMHFLSKVVFECAKVAVFWAVAVAKMDIYSVIWMHWCFASANSIVSMLYDVEHFKYMQKTVSVCVQ